MKASTTIKALAKQYARLATGVEKNIRTATKDSKPGILNGLVWFESFQSFNKDFLMKPKMYFQISRLIGIQPIKATHIELDIHNHLSVTVGKYEFQEVRWSPPYAAEAVASTTIIGPTSYDGNTYQSKSGILGISGVKYSWRRPSVFSNSALSAIPRTEPKKSDASFQRVTSLRDRLMTNIRSWPGDNGPIPWWWSLHRRATAELTVKFISGIISFSARLMPLEGKFVR